jgi:hypothetical protein
MENKEIFAATYTQSFLDAYPQLGAANSAPLIEKAIATALKNIRIVSIEGAAFKLTAKRLGIKHSYKAFEEFLTN